MNTFIIGNGESRKDFDLESLRDKGEIYGCNALYRDFSPTLLFATDQDIILEIMQENYCAENECCFSDWDIIPIEMYEIFQESLGPVIHIGERESAKAFSVIGQGSGGFDVTYIIWIAEENIKSFPNQYSFDTGTIAIHEGSKNGNVVYLLGFDLGEIEEGKNNNIYKDTNGYSPSESKMTKSPKWINEIKFIMENNPNVVYYRVDDSNQNPEEWNDLENVKCISYNEFKSEINAEAVL